jgi:hypothetical protein
VSNPPYVNDTNYSSFSITACGEVGASMTYSISDGTTTISGSRASVPASGKWNANPNLATVKNGPITLIVTETDPAGNPTVQTIHLTKQVVTLATPTVALAPTSDSGASGCDYITNVTTPKFAVTAGSGTTTTVYVNAVAYTTGQVLAAGSTAVSVDPYGNVFATGSAPKTLVIVTAPPSGSWTVSGGKVITACCGPTTRPRP